MKKRVRCLAITLLAFAVTFTSLPALTGSFDAFAYTRPIDKPVISNTVANSAKRTNDAIWSKTNDAESYDLSWKARGAQKWASKNISKTRGVTSGLTIKGLYEVRVRAKNSEGTGPWSDTVYRYFHTTERIRVASKRNGSFTISWKKNPQATGYQVMYSTKKNGAGAAKNITTISKGKTSFTKTGLKKGTVYYVQIRELRKVGNKTYIGNISCPTAVKTKGVPTVTGLKVTAKTQNSVTLAWNKQSANLTGYAIYRDGKYIGTSKKDVSSFKNTGLAVGKQYTYKVRAFYKNGTKYSYGGYSNAVSVSTTDTKFASSTLSNKTVDIESGGQYVSFSVNSSGSVKWNISGDACTIYGSATNKTVSVYCYLVGTSKLTCTNHDGSKKTCTITVKKGSSGENNGGEDPEDPNGISTSYGTIYPSADGSFTIRNDYSNSGNWYSDPVKVNGLECNLSVITELPSDSVLKIDINDMNSSTSEAMGRFYTFSQSSIQTSETEKVLLINDNHPRFYLVDAGQYTIKIGVKSFSFVVTGKCETLCNYLSFVKGWANRSELAGKSDFEKLEYTTRYIVFNYTYSTSHGNGCALYTYGKGNCDAGSNMFKDLCESMGYRCELFSPYDTHTACYVYVESDTYYVEVTPEGGSNGNYWYTVAKQE